jgi:LysM repeat protein
MRLSKRRVGVLVVLALSLVILAACDRGASRDPLAGGTAAPLSVTDTTPTGAETETPTSIAVNVTPTPTDTPLPVATSVPTTVPPTNTPVPTTPPTVASPTPTQVPGAATTYTVLQGDRLFSIGRKFGVNPYSIAQANNLLPPYFIYPGQVLQIPGTGGTTPQPPPGGRTYVVAPGDNLFRIALKFGTSVQALAAANNIGNVNLIFIGQTLKIP